MTHTNQARRPMACHWRRTETDGDGWGTIWNVTGRVP